MDGIYRFLFPNEPTRLTEEAKRLAEQFVIENPDDPVSKAYLEGLTGLLGHIKKNRIAKEQMANTYPFVGTK